MQPRHTHCGAAATHPKKNFSGRASRAIRKGKGMACYWPIPALQQENGTVKLWPPLGTASLAIPCGRCIGCKTDRATMWADRCQHEAKKYSHNTFITLTYDDKFLPPEGHLDADELQRFFKRLREKARHNRTILSDSGTGIRYFACGEYGSKNARPHYHAILFNCDFTDKYKIGRAKNGDTLYHSDILRDLWPYGNNSIGNATGATASYIAQYALKKQGREDADEDGVWRPAPFLRMSLRPAIGAHWLEQNADDLRKGYFVRDGKPRKIPRTYLQKIKNNRPELYEDIQYNITKHSHGDKNDIARLRASELIHQRRKQLTEERNL